ncbi:hypothetical protein F4054_16250 [Candidatus Poribacteria bacterium]|nr:hypothetical protein [Candidatus Poribacteria bacterium]MYK23794.1 hypothetical protein [Candidatus Poribacteria bacterium]
MRYDKNRFKIQALPHPLSLLWVLFPVFMFNELILGQRVPKVTLIDKEGDKPSEERSYIPCPHCETLNDRRLWATKGNAFGHWFGLVCPNCYQIIPCLWNIFSLAILAITFPLWYFPVRFFRHRWIEKEKERLADGLERPPLQATSIHSLRIGIVSGVSGWVMWVIFEVVRNGGEWDLKTMLESLPFCFLVGFVSDYSMKEIKKEKERLANVPERPLIRAKSINWFLRGTFYFGGFLWVAFEILPEMWKVLNGGKWDLRMMFDMLPFCLLVGFVWGSFMHVATNLKGRKGRKT